MSESRHMLVLKRRPSEAIKIGEALVTILSVEGRSVRLGIQAPESVRIVRAEIESRPVRLYPAA